MRKQYQWIVLILLAAVFCCTRQHSIRACGTNAIVCPGKKKKTAGVVKTKPVKKITQAYGVKETGSVYMFTDPFIYSN